MPVPNPYHGHLHRDLCRSLHLQLRLRAVPLHRAGLPSAASLSAIPFPSRYSFAFFQSGSYFASFCCISNPLPFHNIFSPHKCWDHFLISNSLSFTQVLIPLVGMSPLHLVPTAASSAGHEESGTLNPSSPSVITPLSRDSNLTEPNHRVIMTLWK